MNQQKKKEEDTPSQSRNTEHSPPKQLTKEQLSKMSANEAADYFGKWVVWNLNRNVMAEDKGRSKKP